MQERIKLVMRMNSFSDRRKMEREYLAWLKEHAEIKDCPFSVITFLESNGYLKDRRAVGAPESNRSYINSLPNRKLAELTISYSEKPDFDYNYDDELEWCGTIDVWTTSDGMQFNDLDSAIDHETWWLDQPHKNEVAK